MAASSSGARLPSPVKAMADSLPREDGDLLRYLATHDECDFASSSSGKPAKKHHQQQGKKRHLHRAVDHNASSSSPSPGKRSSSCGYFERYAKYWSRWSASPNQRVIDDALELNDSLQAQAQAQGSRKCVWPAMGAKKDKQQKRAAAKDDAKKEANASDAITDVEKASPEEKKIEQDKDKKPSRKQAEKKEEAVSKPPKSKQVAPLEFKEDEEDIEEAGVIETRKPQSFGTKASEALGFVCEKLLRMWYPRLRRRS
ncbi:hypothetical protein SELMODRAFT_439803 [Selaginella moellendorffii]|uniref:Uncharacterized protein n=1 Tax=Selaginella moellendorffii TaxID=88036 RepID=D8R7E1_SELML|nr:nucleolar protein 58 [Selaginella moellendorffii]EFJ31507.1 hypothetical protein SELMODRAFT_439803 [Selaginella moellendorffii]|eukprot:XP_002966908.1 nucleolar protein 58 [Selaginella moellendorffii]